MTTISNSTSAVSVIGLGAMGLALAEAFLREGYATTVWNRSPEKANRLLEKGATRATTVVEAVAASPVIVVCVLNYEVVQEILNPLGKSLAGKMLINLTNGTPQQARDMSTWATTYGAEYLDGGIMAIPPMIGQSEALILYSGSQKAYDMATPLLKSLGTPKYLGADPGLASLYDLSLLSAMYGMIAGYLHAIALADSERIKATDFTPLVMNWLQAMMQALPHLAQQIDSGNYGNGVVSTLSMQSIGYINIIEASKAQGIRVDLLLPLKELLEQGVKQGYGAYDLSSLIEMIRKPLAKPV